MGLYLARFVPVKANFSAVIFWPYIKSLLTKLVRSRWLRSFFAFLWTSASSRSIKTKTKNKKRELGRYPAILTSRLVNNAYFSPRFYSIQKYLFWFILDVDPRCNKCLRSFGGFYNLPKQRQKGELKIIKKRSLILKAI